jgi:hypothetical protein
MKQENFEDYWKKHQADYIDYAKSIALKDFNELSKLKAGKFVTRIKIDTDDDFCFGDGDFYPSFEVYGNSKKEILKNTIDFIQNLKITYGSQSKWEFLRDEAIQRLRKGEFNFSFGGNQRIDLFISENSPRVKLKNKI